MNNEATQNVVAGQATFPDRSSSALIQPPAKLRHLGLNVLALIQGTVLMLSPDSGAAANRVVAHPGAGRITASVNGKRYTADDLEEAAAAAELAMLTLSSDMLERIAAEHQPPADWYHASEERPF